MLKILVYEFLALLSYNGKLLARFLNVESFELVGGISDLGDDFNLLLKANTYKIDLLDYCFFQRLKCYVLFCDDMSLIFNEVLIMLKSLELLFMSQNTRSLFSRLDQRRYHSSFGCSLANFLI